MTHLNEYGERIGHRKFNRPKFWRKTRAIKRQLLRNARKGLISTLVGKKVLVSTDGISVVRRLNS